MVITKALPPATSDAYKMAIGWSTSGSPVFLLRRRGGTAAVTVDGNGCGFLIVLNVGWVFMVRVSSVYRPPSTHARGMARECWFLVWVWKWKISFVVVW